MATASINCEACEALRQEVPELVCNGFDDDMCSALSNDSGLSASSGHNDCTDLNNLNDCLIGNEAEEVELFEVCDWKPFMKDFINNLWTVLKAMICAICGIWTNIHNLWAKINEVINKVNCVFNNVTNLANALARTTGGASFVRYYRDNYGAIGIDSPYFWDAPLGSSHILDIYMDAEGDNPGSQAADRDYVVIMSCCVDFHGAYRLEVDTTLFSSADTRTMKTIRDRQGQHPCVHINNEPITAFSWPVSSAVLIKKGAHPRIETYVSSSAGTNPHFQIHQITLTWIPVNVDSGFDPSSVIVEC